MAMGVLDQAHTLGLDVPGRLSVAGFDDIDEAARADPPLTTVRQRLFEQGRLAAGIALDLVDGRTPSVPRLGTQLVVRDTTGQPPRSRRVLPPADR
jgi:LacI family transcriptional regulator